MSTTVQRSPKSGRQSLFFHDMASPISTHRGKFNTQGQGSAGSSHWRDNFVSSDLPPPPIFTLEDRLDFSPEIGAPDFPISSPSMKSDLRTPARGSTREFLTPTKDKYEANAYTIMNTPQNQMGSASSSWWSPAKSNSEQEDKGKGSPVEGVVQPGALITLPPLREVAKPELYRKGNTLPVVNLDEEEWITVYGFPPGDTNLVLREFEKCGMILKRVPGPSDANWMHILYQNRSNAMKALNKNGVQINGALIVGVKPLDPMQREAVNDKVHHQGFMPLPLPTLNKSSDLNRVDYIQNRSTSSMAFPSKSVLSKLTDLMFGF